MYKSLTLAHMTHHPRQFQALKGKGREIKMKYNGMLYILNHNRISFSLKIITFVKLLLQKDK